MLNTQLLIESISPNEGNLITESMTDGKDVFLHGIFMQAEQRNRNNRVYPLSEMSKAVASARHLIEQHGGIFGELDHPKGATINMDRISHVITDLYMEGNNVIGKAKLLNTPMGLIAKELGRSGTRYGVSSRGGGRLDESGVVSDFSFITVDLVATPSAAGAMPNTVYESLMDSTKGQQILTLAESVRNDPDAQKHFIKAFHSFFESFK